MLKLLILFAGLSIGCSNICNAQSARSLRNGTIISSPDPVLGWTEDPWTSNDKQYMEIRKGIAKLIKAGQNPVVLMKKYKIDALQNPANAEIVFRYAYASYQVALSGPVTRKDSDISYALYAMGYVPQTHSYEFNRLRFLVQSEIDTSHAYLNLGNRLLEKNPQDLQVKYYLTNMLVSDGNSEERERAIHYANDLIKASPKNPNMYALLGGIYFVSWLKTRSPVDGGKSVTAYNKYLQRASPQDPFRKHVNFTMRWIETGKVPLG